MKIEEATEVIEEINKKPEIHYDELLEKTRSYINKDELYALLYSLCAEKVIIEKEADGGGRSIERSVFAVNKDLSLNELKDLFYKWRL